MYPPADPRAAPIPCSSAASLKLLGPLESLIDLVLVSANAVDVSECSDATVPRSLDDRGEADVVRGNVVGADTTLKAMDVSEASFHQVL